MSLVACNLCGADACTTLYEAGVAQVNRIVKCTGCGLMYSNPRTNGSDIESIARFDPEYVLAHIDAGRMQKEQLQTRDYRSTRTLLREWFPRRGRLVEVGSGLGYLLDFFRQDGWETFGVEPDAGLALHAERRLGLRVVPDVLENAKIEGGTADVVLMMHVIEHVPDPTGTLREIHRILRPGGVLVLETPRYDTLMFRLLGRRERSLSCDGHIYFFTTRTLASLALKTGFETVRTDCVGRSLTLDRLLYNLGIISKSQAVKKLCRAVSERLGLRNRTLTINVRDMERLYLRKPRAA